MLIVLDLSDPDWQNQMQIVEEILNQLGASSNRHLIANKVDSCEKSAIELIQSIDSNVIYISATSGAGLDGLKIFLENQFWGKDSEYFSSR